MRNALQREENIGKEVGGQRQKAEHVNLHKRNATQRDKNEKKVHWSFTGNNCTFACAHVCVYACVQYAL